MPIDEEILKNEILQGLRQEDSSFMITSFFGEYDPKSRSLNVSFEATNDNGETVSEVISYA